MGNFFVCQSSDFAHHVTWSLENVYLDFFFLFFHKIRSFDNCDCRESLELGKNVIIYMSACMFMRWKILGSEHVDMYLWRERENWMGCEEQ